MNEIPAGIPLAPPWSLTAGALGRGSVVAAIVLFVVAALLSLKAGRFERIATAAFSLGCVGLLGAFGVLATLFAKDQFQYAYVWQHSDATTTLPYKIASVWTAQEGSFLLWGCASAALALFALKGTGPYRRGFVGVTSLFLGTISGILAYETPFKIMPQIVAHGKTFVPPAGNGMVPSLQNYWVIVHPPTIFVGFGTLSVLAAYALAAMLRGDAEDWVSRVRPWALFSTAILGLGVVMGGLWAYETQGWGGFWAWDPVENVSFVPWLTVVAFVHGLIVQAARRKWAGTNLILGVVPFLLFAYGTFLTRSGLLDGVSNHSFASMDANARGILKIFLLAAIGLSAAAYAGPGRAAAARANAQAQPDEAGWSRESLYRYGVLFLCLLSTIITLGMSWPVITALRGGEGSAVKPALYHLVVVWFFLPLMAMMAITPFVSWRSMEGKALRERLFGVLCVSLGLTGLLHLAILPSVHPEAGATVAAPFGRALPLPLWMLVLLFSVTFVLVANVWRTVELVRRSALGTGGFVAHLGLAVLLGGLILSQGYERKTTLNVRRGAPASGLGYTVALRGATTNDLDDRSRKVEFDVTTPEGGRFVARPGHYQYRSGEETKDQVWPAIERFPARDVYVAMNPPQVAATPQPLTMKPGEAKELGDGIRLEYLEATDNGKFGQVGAEFGAKMRLTAPDAQGEPHRYVATPTIGITPDGLQPVSIPPIGPDLVVALYPRMDAATHAVDVQLFFSPPIYPIELYEKPFTGLVWLGCGVLTLGGLMSAFARRRVVARRRRSAPSLQDAPLPAPQG